MGPAILATLYAAGWMSWIPKQIKWPLFAIGIPLGIILCGVMIWLKRNPGGPVRRFAEDGGLVHRRSAEGELELELAKQRDAKKLLLAQAATDVWVRRVAYKEDAYEEIDKLRGKSNGYRSVNNLLQGVLIVGSLAATGVSGLAIKIDDIRWATMGLTFLVGMSSGFMGYFKYKERSFYLQQTADAIEQEWEAVEVGIGRYKALPEEQALAEFVEEVHRLKSEQRKRQQNLEQPPDERKQDSRVG